MTEWMDLDHYPGPPEERDYLPLSSNGTFVMGASVPNQLKPGDIYFQNGQPVGVIVNVNGETVTISTNNGPT